MARKTKRFLSSQAGAPVLAGLSGSLIALLNTVLITGFNLRTVTAASAAAGMVTMTVGTGHGFTTDDVIVAAGATGASAPLNGEHEVVAISSDSITVAATIPDGAAAGSITVKIAPLGWGVTYSATNLAVYAPVVPEATGCLLRVDDSDARSARVIGYESMIDVNTGFGPFPTPDQQTGGYFWDKSNAADSSYRNWFIAGDDRCFYFCCAPYVDTMKSSVVMFFGDIASLKSGDAYSCVLSGGPVKYYDSGQRQAGCIGLSWGDLGEESRSTAIARSFTGLGGSVLINKTGMASHRKQSVLSGEAGYGYCGHPNNADNSLLFTQVIAIEGFGYRGFFPGIWHILNPCVNQFSTGALAPGAGILSGKKLVALQIGLPANGGIKGTVFFDITGPWR